MARVNFGAMIGHFSGGLDDWQLNRHMHAATQFMMFQFTFSTKRSSVSFPFVHTLLNAMTLLNLVLERSFFCFVIFINTGTTKRSLSQLDLLDFLNKFLKSLSLRTI